MEALDDVRGWANAERACGPGTICIGEEACVAGSGVGKVVDHVGRVMDENFSRQGEGSLVALLCDCIVVHVLFGPAPLDSAVVLGIVESS